MQLEDMATNQQKVAIIIKKQTPVHMHAASEKRSEAAARLLVPPLETRLLLSRPTTGPTTETNTQHHRNKHTAQTICQASGTRRV